MKLFFICASCRNKAYINSAAKSRQQLANSWGRVFAINCMHCPVQNQVDVNAVEAEASRGKVPLSTTLAGGALGALAGPLGIIIGLVAGGVTGGVIRSNESNDVRYFNTYYVN